MRHPKLPKARTVRRGPTLALRTEPTPPSQRPGPFYYVWNPDSISRRNFGIGPATQKQLGAFATQAIVHQPLDYVRAVVIDLWRYGEPATGRNWWYAGQTDAAFAFGARDPSVEQLVVSAMSRGYRGAQPHVRGEQLLNAYQQIFRVTGLVLASLLSLALIGVWRVRGPLRTAILLFGLGAIGLYILPVATVSYDARYASHIAGDGRVACGEGAFAAIRVSVIERLLGRA